MAQSPGGCSYFLQAVSDVSNLCNDGRPISCTTADLVITTMSCINEEMDTGSKVRLLIGLGACCKEIVTTLCLLCRSIVGPMLIEGWLGIRQQRRAFTRKRCGISYNAAESKHSMRNKTCLGPF